MIDLIKMKKPGIENIPEIVARNKLQTNSKDGVLYYDNVKTKDLTDGFYIKVETAKPKNVKLECSLHKYWNAKINGMLTNFDNEFSFEKVKESIRLLSEDTGISLSDFKILYYEIGLNLYVSKPCIEYISKIHAVGDIDHRKELFINPRYKDKKVKISEFYEEIKKVYKVYDKTFEMERKRSKHLPAHPNILRIETIQKRVDNLTLNDLIDSKTIARITEMFFRDWRTIQFEKIIIAPRGTHANVLRLIQDILIKGRDNVLKEAYSDMQKGLINERRYQYIKTFIESKWNTFKNELKIEQTEEEKEIRELIKRGSILSIY